MNANGRVQGVGFRYSTKLLADRTKIIGWVKNENNGSVSIVAQADDDKLDKFIEDVRASPSPSGRVTKLVIKQIPPINQNGFIVKY